MEAVKNLEMRPSRTLRQLTFLRGASISEESDVVTPHTGFSAGAVWANGRPIAKTANQKFNGNSVLEIQ